MADFNSCDDFFVTTVVGHIVAAYAELSGDFDLTEIWMNSDEDREKTLSGICNNIMEKYLKFSHNMPRMSSDDKKLEYAIQIISMGCFYMEYSDAIREGDGERILRCWRYLLPIFWNSGRTNYANEVLNMLFQHDFSLSPRHATDLLWGRSINVHGRKGKNVSADLHMEHMNRVVKDCIKGLGSNQTERAIVRVSKALGTIIPVLDQYDEQNNIPSISGRHKVLSIQKNHEKICKELTKQKILQYIPRRKHDNFPNPRDVLHGKNKVELTKWMEQKLAKYYK